MISKVDYMDQEKIDKLAKIVWDYHHVNHQLKKADCIFVLGSHDLRVAEYAAQLFLDGYAPYIIFSGGLGRLTEGVFDKPEADKFADIAIKLGVPREKIIIENKSTNTSENILFTKKLLAEMGLDFGVFILVQKPYMERRTLATFTKWWPEKEFIVTSPNISFEDYPNEEISKDDLIHFIIGDLQRIKIYPERGFSAFQEIPDDVWDAYLQLADSGYTDHLIVK